MYKNYKFIIKYLLFSYLLFHHDKTANIQLWLKQRYMSAPMNVNRLKNSRRPFLIDLLNVKNLKISRGTAQYVNNIVYQNMWICTTTYST